MNPFPPADAAALLAPAQGGPRSPGCAGCHAYPLTDVHHQYHLASVNATRNNRGDERLNGPLTCMDCHFGSVRHFGYTHADTVWMDSAGVELEEHTSPSDQVLRIDRYPRWRPLPYSGGDTARGEALAREIDRAGDSTAREGKLLEWMTAFAHEDGRVQVTFPPNVIAPAESLSTAFRPADLSCSSVACHSTRNVAYRWKDPGRGLGGCPSPGKDDPTCGEKPK